MQRGVRRPRHHPRQGRGALDVPAAGHLRHRDRRRGGLRRRRRNRCADLAIRTTPPTSSPPSGPPCSATASSATSACSPCSATILTSASASTQTTILPTARTTLSMGVYKALPDVVREDPPQVPDPDGVDDRDGRGLDLLLRAVHPDQQQPAAGADRLGRPDDRLLLRADRLRLRLVLPQDADHIGARLRDARRRAAARRRHADGGLRLRPDLLRQARLPGRRRRQQRDDPRLRRGRRRRHRGTGARRDHDVRLVGDVAELLQG